MVDFIFMTGPSAVGKTTLAGRLYRRLGGVYIEQNMVPDFVIPIWAKDEGVFEEQTCWGNLLRQAEYFRSLAFHNIIILDFDDLRTRDIPLIFKGQRFMILRLCSSNPEQIKVQMIHRAKAGAGLYDLELAVRANEKMLERPLLPNERKLDISGKTPEQVLDEAAALAEAFEPQLDYNYLPDDAKNYMTWVKSKAVLTENG